MANTQTTKGFNDLINDLKVEANFQKMGHSLALINPGDWKGLVKWAKYFGYSIQLSDLYNFFASEPKIFEKLMNDAKLSQWNLNSLKTAMTAPATTTPVKTPPAKTPPGKTS